MSSSLPAFLLQFRGEFAALTAALIWAIASVIYTGVGRQVSPLILNLTKGWIAIVFLVMTLLLRGQPIPAISLTSWILLLLSGILGIALGDTAYFNTLNCIGARRTLVLETLSPSLSALLALIFLQESLSLSAWWGIGLTLIGVIWVVVERVPQTHAQTHFRPLRGLFFGVLAALGQSGGAVLSRAALAGTDVDPLWSTLIRLLGCTIVLLLWVIIRGQYRSLLKPLQSRHLLNVIIGTAFVSTYLGIWLQQTALKYAATGIAQALTNTSPLFILPIAFYMGEKISVRAVLGVAIALTGVWLLFKA
ncbi:DMT family transporter [Phormidesmis priestleyi]